ncbi:uncharacterized protein LOC107483637 [Arachis duranensis]|uniref:Uncharacterized protein LOC107483637 n=1 Tax=Arachis duranensis TaxID=130453 RepID=A0A6P4CZC1_ARADU|nr:uncharacterized protein LOC107483637 [Arachis duranensis]
MPRLWNTKLDSGSYGERPVPASVQLRQIILLHEGKARDAHHTPSSLLHLSSATNLSLNHYSFCHRCCHCISSFIQICRRCYVSSFVHICDCRLSPLRSTQDRLSLFL